MKDIEINSDKPTVIAVFLVLALVLFVFLSDLYDLAGHRIRPGSSDIWIYPGVIFNVFAVVSVGRDRTIRRSYPYGLVGFSCFAGTGILRIAAHWLGLATETNRFFWTALLVIDIGASVLIIAEGIRWFRRKLKEA